MIANFTLSFSFHVAFFSIFSFTSPHFSSLLDGVSFLKLRSLKKWGTAGLLNGAPSKLRNVFSLDRPPPKPFSPSFLASILRMMPPPTFFCSPLEEPLVLFVLPAPSLVGYEFLVPLLQQFLVASQDKLFGSPLAFFAYHGTTPCFVPRYPLCRHRTLP